MRRRPLALADSPVLHRDAVFTPSGRIVRLRRDKTVDAAMIALSAASEPFHCPEGAELDLAILAGILSGTIEVM